MNLNTEWARIPCNNRAVIIIGDRMLMDFAFLFTLSNHKQC